VRVDGVDESPVQVEDQRAHGANLVGGDRADQTERRTAYG
jgi:hypothetical protein